jgi:hypothetical protein
MPSADARSEILWSGRNENYAAQEDESAGGNPPQITRRDKGRRRLAELRSHPEHAPAEIDLRAPEWNRKSDLSEKAAGLVAQFRPSQFEFNPESRSGV